MGCFRNGIDTAEGLSSEELELMEVALEAMSSIMLHPQTHKYQGYIVKHTANILFKFVKILERERCTTDSNKVSPSIEKQSGYQTKI